jgi:hypothetical protein
VPALRTACEQLGIQFDAIGATAGRISTVPEQELPIRSRVRDRTIRLGGAVLRVRRDRLRFTRLCRSRHVTQF